MNYKNSVVKLVQLMEKWLIRLDTLMLKNKKILRELEILVVVLKIFISG